MNMLLKGFGCLLFAFCFSFSLRANDLPAFSEHQDTDTTISLTDERVESETDSMNITESEEPGSTIMEENTPLRAEMAPKTLVISQKNYNALDPRALTFVRDYEVKHEERLGKIVTKYAGQIETIERILSGYEIPVELKYLALIESGFHTTAVSRKGAVGPWQFMAPTGRLMGLTINQQRDERRDLKKSTHAAAKYLKALYNQFNDWLLVIAAYNGGSSRVVTAINKSQSRDFWKLQYYLPLESRMHVKKYIAARFILEKQTEEMVIPFINMDKLFAENLSGLSVFHIQGKYDATVMMQELDIDAGTFNEYNPNFEEEVSTSGYNLRLPEDKMMLFLQKDREILHKSVDLLLENNATVFSNDRKRYPDTIVPLQSTAIISTAGGQKIMKNK